jgi:hypothetical protein
MATLDQIYSVITRIHDTLKDIVRKTQIVPTQIVVGEGLSEISERLGLIQAGEFRTGNGIEPGLGFSGVRIGYPAFTYDNEEWHVVGINDDVLQFGLRASDGTAVAGAGGITLNSTGIIFTNTSGVLHFENAAGTATPIRIFGNSNDEFLIQHDTPGKGLQFAITLTNTDSPYLWWGEDQDFANVAKLMVNAAATATHVVIGGDNTPDISMWANNDGKETVFNDNSYDIDFRIEGGSNANLFKIDAGTDQVLIDGKDALLRLLPFASYTHTNPMTVTNSEPFSTTIPQDLVLKSWQQAFYVATTNDANNYWTIRLIRKSDGATIAELDTSGSAPDTDLTLNTTTFSIGSVTTAGKAILVRCIKSGSGAAPGSLYIHCPGVKVTV